MNGFPVEQSSRSRKRIESRQRKNRALYQLLIQSTEEKCVSHSPGEESTHSQNECSIKKRKVENILSPEELAELREKLRERQIQKMCKPSFYLNEVGMKSQIHIDSSERIPIFVSDLQCLLLYSLIGKSAPYHPRWCEINRYNILNQVEIILLDGLNLNDFLQQDFRFMKTLENQLEVLLPQKEEFSIIQELLCVPLSLNQKNRIVSIPDAISQGHVLQIMKFLFPIKTLNLQHKFELLKGNEVIPRTALLLNSVQLLHENYPLPIFVDRNDHFMNFRFTKDYYESVTPTSPLIAIDCEMCTTTLGQELTRVAVVAEDYKVLYHSLVIPEGKILDYVTRYSGITRNLLRGVTTKLKDVQDALCTLLPRDAILVGQSLNCDLKALKLMHPYIIDTSVVYNVTGNRGRKTKLSVLTSMFLQEQIQQKESGHDPIEDSISAMKLIQLKLQKGLSFGDVLLHGEIPVLQGEFKNAHEKLVPAEEAKFKTSLTTNLLHYVQAVKKKSLYVGPAFDNVTQPLLNNILSCKLVTSVKDTFNISCKKASNFDFVITNVSLNEELRGEKNWSSVLGKVDRRVDEKVKCSKRNSLFVILFSGSCVPTTWQSGVCLVHLKL